MSRAGLPAEESDLIDIDELIAAYYERVPDPAVPEQRVAFGTSGHRGSSLSTSFNEVHILATTQAIVDYRTANGIAGPLFLGRDTHGLSRPAERSAIESWLRKHGTSPTSGQQLSPTALVVPNLVLRRQINHFSPLLQ